MPPRLTAAPATSGRAPPPGTRRRLSLHARLWLLVAAVAVPLLGLGSEAIWAGYQSARTRAGNELVDEARTRALALDGMFAATRAVLVTLANAPSLAAGDSTDFAQRLRAASAALPGHPPLALWSADATLLASSADGSAAGNKALAGNEKLATLVRRTAASGREEISPLPPAANAPFWHTAMALPLSAGRSGENPGRVLTASLGSGLGAALPRRQADAPGEDIVAAIIAPDGTLVARTPGRESASGKAAPLLAHPALLEHLRREPFGLIVDAATRAGVPGVRAFARAPQSGFAVTLVVPQARFEGPLRAALARLLGFGSVLLLGGLAAAYLLARGIVRAVGRVTRVAAEGGDTGLPELDRLATILSREEAARRQAQAAQEAEHGELIDVLGSIGDAFYAIDSGWHVAFANRRALELFDRSEADLLGRPLLAALPELQGSLNIARYREVMTDGTSRAFRALSPVMGRWTDYTVYPRRGGGVAIYLRDISAQVAAEQALRGSEARLRLAQRIGGVGSFEWTPDSGRIAISEEFAALHGLPPGRTTLERDDLIELVHSRDRDGFEADLQRVLHAGPTFDLGYRIVRAADGETRWMVGRGEVFRSETGAVTRVVGVVQDVSETREAQRHQDEALAVLNSLLDNAPIGLAFFDRAHRAARLNGAVARLAGRPVEALLGRPPGELLGDPSDRLEHVVEAVFRSGAPISDIELTASVDGQARLWLAGFYPVPDPDGGVLWVGAVVADITERRRDQQQLHRLNETLEARVKSEVAAREDAQNRLAHAERMQALGQLAGGMAHDFNNVLQAVSGCAALIGRRPDKPENVQRLARRIIDAAERGGATTRRLLAFARRDELRAEAIAPAALLGGLREMIAPVLGSAMRLEVVCEDGLPPVLADRGQLETVLVNLAVNARDAMPEGGRLEVSARREDVAPREEHPAALKPGPYLRLAVADSGRGMDAATLARATEPFFTTKAKGKGTGLGLAMARGFAEQSGGGLMLESAPGQGTTVTLWLPTGSAFPAPARAPTPTAASARRILLVDDDRLVRETVAAQLGDAGYTVSSAAGGEAALDMLKGDAAPDLLLTDFSMPGMNGLALIRAARLRRPGLPALLLTGYAGEAEELAAGLPERFALLRKPAGQNELVARIEALLGT